MTVSPTDVFKQIFLKWERLRLPYNAILCLYVCLLAPGLIRFALIEILVLVGGCVGANLCFLAGPVLEAYLAWLGYRSNKIMPMLFIAGVLLSFPLVMYIAAQMLWRLN